MIQLFIEGKLVDIDEKFDIKLEKDFNNLTEHIIEESEYSFEVELPVTKANREAFGYADVADVTNKFIKTFDAVLVAEEVCLLKGKFMLSEIDSEYFSGNLYVPARKKLKDVLGDRKMKDIKKHDMFIASWDDISAINTGIIENQRGADRHICFPYVLYRLPYNNTESTLNNYTQDLSPSANTFTTENVFPAYNVLSVLKDCFETEGYKLQGNVFGIEKFKELYQTFSVPYKDYHDSKNTPYYVSFHASYSMRKGNNNSSTLVRTSLFNDPDMDIGTDAILLSENTTITDEIDDYNMLAKGKASDSHSLIVPKSGWYRIHCNGSMNFPVNGGWFEQDEREDVDGCYNEADRCDLSQNIFEFQIKKTLEPMSNTNYYSFNCATPMVPTNLSKENIQMVDLPVPIGFAGALYGIVLSYDDARNKFAKNGRTAIVKDYSGFDISEFVAGARFGCHFASRKYDEERTEDRLSEEMVFTCLPNPAKTTKSTYTDDGGKEHPYMLLYNDMGVRRNDSDTYRYDYGSQTAQVLVRHDSYSNFEGYNKFTPNRETASGENISGGTWDTTTNYQAKSYPGQNLSYASVGAGKRSGMWNINTCVWLEEGELISPEIVVPFVDYADSCGTFEFCDWKHYYMGGILWTSVEFNFEMGIVSTDKKWVPTANNPMPSFYEIRTPKPTNVNQWLGDTKVNDYIENFLNTFNLRLTRVNNTTYSIDTLANESESDGNIVNVDNWVNAKDAKYSRIDLSNTKLEWTISTDEEGYVHGNNTKIGDRQARDESGYTGSVEFINDESTDKVNKTKSNWSYTWLKDISFVNGDYAFPSGTKEVPIVGDASLWENTYLTIQDEDYATDKTSRLIYLDKDPETGMYNFFNIIGYKNDTEIPEKKAPLIFCKNYLQYKNSLDDDVTFRLDYDNTYSTKDDKTITDIFYRIKKGYQYEVDLPVTLPNDYYHKLRSNSYVKYNDGLYKCLGIEGHDVNMSDKATIKLISL